MGTSLRLRDVLQATFLATLQPKGKSPSILLHLQSANEPTHDCVEKDGRREGRREKGDWGRERGRREGGTEGDFNFWTLV